MSLNSSLSSLGIRISSGRTEGVCDIEKSIIEIILDLSSDGRLYGLLFNWIKTHGNYVIVEKLRKLLKNYSLNGEQQAWLVALAIYGKVHCSHKWKSLVRRFENEVYLLPKEISEYPIKVNGAIEWLEEYNLLLPKSSLRIREQDILSPKELIKINKQYRNRYLYGPSWRSDIITAMEEGANTPTRVAKKVGCSYEPAYRVFHEYLLAKT